MQRLDGKMMGPNFLGIGAPRSGSAWLHTMLSNHPDIWLPPIKEVHYFDSIDPTIDEQIHVDSLSFRLKWKFINRAQHYAAYCLKDFIKETKNKAKPDLRWDYSFFKPGGSLDWYRELFNRPGESIGIKGEITPAYIMLGSEMIKTIKEELNVRKIILVLRNPIYATWSVVEKQARDGHMQAGNNNLEDLIKRAKSPGLLKRYSYADHLSRWLTHYNQDDIFIGFFEELEQDPAALLSRIFSYLDVEDISSQLRQKATKRINKSSGSLAVIPYEVKRELALIHHDQVDRLRKYVKGYTENWYEEIQTILKEQDGA
jgi:hypothetical protein